MENHQGEDGVQASPFGRGLFVKALRFESFIYASLFSILLSDIAAFSEVLKQRHPLSRKASLALRERWHPQDGGEDNTKATVRYP